MNKFKQWWEGDLSKGVKFVFLVLLANGLPAFFILMTLPTMTDTLFVWTIKPEINARLIGVMYSNALLLVAFGAFQRSWARVRVIMVVITLFSVLATTLTFFFLKPFLAHPWYHLAYWLTMYLILFFAAPYVFLNQEKEHGGRLPVQVPLRRATRLLTGFLAIISLAGSLALVFNVETVNRLLPWTLPPLVGGLIGVLFFTHTAAYTWALWDGDWLRVRPMVWQIPVTAFLFLLLPLLHTGDLRPGTGSALATYAVLAGLVALAGVGVILGQRSALANPVSVPHDETR